ncbi:signal-transducing histidine kinase-like protein, partial [Haloferax sp. BAB-2207]
RRGTPGVNVRVGPLEDGFFVEDDGPGIPPEEQDRIFESGYSTDSRGDRSRSRHRRRRRRRSRLGGDGDDRQKRGRAVRVPGRLVRGGVRGQYFGSAPVSS